MMPYFQDLVLQQDCFLVVMAVGSTRRREARVSWTLEGGAKTGGTRKQLHIRRAGL